MSSVKELLKKIINEEIEKLEEVSIVGVSSAVRQKALSSPEALAQYLVSQNKSSYVNEDEGLVVQNGVKKMLRAAAKNPKVALRASAQTGNFCADAANDGKEVPGLKGFKCVFKNKKGTAVATTPEAAKAAKAASAAGKGKGAGAGKGVAKRKPRKPNKTMAYLQSMLYGPKKFWQRLRTRRRWYLR